MMIDRILYRLAIVLAAYMPFHILLSQSLSLVTGGLEIWKAAKDVLVVVAVPLLFWVVYRRGLYKDPLLKKFLIIGGVYTLLHMLFVLIRSSDDTYSTIVASVYNTRYLAYFLLGYVIAKADRGTQKIRTIVKVMLIASVIVAGFGVLQYFLPKDLLTHIGYSLERGVKPMFFIDNKLDFPRIMSTLRDPNSLGAYLLFPLYVGGYYVFANKASSYLPKWGRTKGLALAALASVALLLTFSRSSYIGGFVGGATLLSIVAGERVFGFVKKYAIVLTLAVVAVAGFSYTARNTYVVQNLIFHADEQTLETDPNELRVEFAKKVSEEVIETPLGHGPGTAGIVSINNPKESLLTENYYLQIFYEVGWLGGVLFLTLLVVIARELLKKSRDGLSKVAFALAVGYVPLSLLNHLWSNEAVALQWWLLSGLLVVATKTTQQKDRIATNLLAKILNIRLACKGSVQNEDVLNNKNKKVIILA
jgi:O-antigen ligase